MKPPTRLGVVFALVAVVLLSTGAPLGTSHDARVAVAGSGSVAPLVPPAPNPFFTGMAASVGLGVYNLTSRGSGTPLNASRFAPGPEDSCSNANGSDVWVPDFGGSRLLEFKAPFTTGEDASLVIGQSTFSGSLGNTTATGLRNPAACAFDSHGNLWLSDFDNARVLEYVPPFATGMAASLVLGQPTFTTGTPLTTATGLGSPLGLTFDAQGDLWVTDGGNNRVLEYVPPFSSGMAASVVLGQATFVTGTTAMTATNLSYPDDVAYASGVLWVADYSNQRVVGFGAPFSSGEGATYLLGQSSFIHAGAVGAAALIDPTGVKVDSRGDLWVSDIIGNRVVEFLPPFTVFETPAVAIGQTSLTTTTSGDTATTLTYPDGVFVSATGALWVTDWGNDRVLEYVPSNYTVRFVATGLPATSNLAVTLGGTTRSAPGPSVSFTEQNGSYPWNVSPISGYKLSPASGTGVVNGANLTIPLTVTQVSYTVTFNALGIPATTSWAVTLGGVTHSSPSNGSISFTTANGTFLFSVANVPGYNATPKSGSVVVNGTGTSVGVAFLTNSSSGGGSSSGFSTGVGLLLIVVALVVGLMVGLLIGRRRKGGTTTPAAWTPPPSPGSPPAPPPPPPPSGGPPPGAMG